MQNILNKIVKYNIYVLVFLVPVFFLPFSFEVFEFNKQYLLFFLVSLAFFAWLAKMVIYDKEVRFRRTPLDIFVLGFLFIAILSAVFSVDKDSSVLGFYGRFSNGLMGLLSLGVLYFLVTNNVRSEEVRPAKEVEPQKIGIAKILNLFFWSSGLVVLTGYFSIFGVWAKINSLFSLPKVMLQNTFNPVAGSLEGLSVFLAVLVVFLVSRLLFNGQGKQILNYLLLFASLILVLIIDFTAAWLIVLITLLGLVGFSMWRRIFRENVNRLLIPIFLIIIAAILIPLQPIKMNLPQEQVLQQGTSWSVGLKSATDNVKSVLLGSGIGTFHYDFAKEKPLSINETWLWQIRFDRAGSALAEILGTMGFLGMLSYLLLIGVSLLVSYLLLPANSFKKSETPNTKLLPLLLIFIALLVGQFVYYQNSTLSFLFWLVLGLAVVSWQKPIKEKIISFKDFPELSLVFSTLTIVLGVIVLVLYFFTVKFYLADVNYNKSLALLGTERVKIQEQTIKLNPYSPRYRVALARTYLYEALAEAQKSQAEQDSVKVQNLVAKAINEARTATTLQPNQVANWEALGVIYREIRQLATGALEWGVKSFEGAIKLEPTNPVLYTELGKLYAVSGDAESARQNFRSALDKKPDYSDALIQEALLLEREDVLDEAIQKIEGLIRLNPYNVEAMFQLGRLYFNNGQIDEAITQFKNVTTLIPDHSNAHYSLGVAYSAKGQTSLAVEEFKKVLELNPGNQDVIQKIRDLQK